MRRKQRRSARSSPPLSPFPSCLGRPIPQTKDPDSPVNHVESVQMLQRNQQLSSVESTPLLVELSFPLQVMEQLSSVDEGEDEIKLLLGLERELEGYDERVVDLSEDGSFREGVDDFGTGDDVGLSDGLESVDSRGITLSNLHDLVRGECREKDQFGKERWESRRS